MSTSSIDKAESKEIDAIEGPVVVGTEAEKDQASTTVEAAPNAQQDGGTRAWLQVAGSFLVFANLWGITFAFGSFQSYYELTYLTSLDASTISWIGTVATFLLIVGGVASGPLFDWGYFRSMLLVGALIETISLFLLSLCSQYYQIFLTQGVLMGLGNGLLYIPGLALVGRSFKKNRGMAMGITTCGAPVGGIIYTLAFESLISRYSFGTTIRIMGAIMAGMYLIAFPLILFRATNVGDIASGTGTTRKLFDPSALRDLPFWAYTSSNFLIFAGYMTPFYFMASYGQLELGMSRKAANYVIIIAQAASIGGRLIASWTSSKTGVMLPWIICATASGVLCLGWIGVSAPPSFMAFAALYGAFSGALIPLPPSVFPVVCPDVRVLGARLGMAQGISSIASLIGSPIAGALTTIGAHGEHRSYLGLQLFGGLIMALGGCNLIVLWLLLIKQRGLKSKLI